MNYNYMQNITFEGYDILAVVEEIGGEEGRCGCYCMADYVLFRRCRHSHCHGNRGWGRRLENRRSTLGRLRQRLYLRRGVSFVHQRGSNYCSLLVTGEGVQHY